MVESLLNFLFHCHLWFICFSFHMIIKLVWQENYNINFSKLLCLRRLNFSFIYFRVRCMSQSLVLHEFKFKVTILCIKLISHTLCTCLCLYKAQSQALGHRHAICLKNSVLVEANAHFITRFMIEINRCNCDFVGVMWKYVNCNFIKKKQMFHFA